MGIEMLTLVLLGCILASFALGAQVGLALGGIAMGVGYLVWGEALFNIIPTTVESTFFNFILLAIPLYIYMGQILTRSGIGDAMFNASQLMIGRVRGSLAISVIGVCSMIGAMVGIIGAGIMTSSSIALKPMLDRGYDKKLALGVIMAGGSLGILIPPSIPMIMFASATQNSVGKMFLGAMVPALITIVLLISYVVISCKIKPERAPFDSDNDIEIPKGYQLFKTIRDGASSFALIVVVLGSIIAGIATPTESGALGVAGAILLSILFKRFKPEILMKSGMQTAMLVSVAMWIILGASVFSNFHLLMGIQGMVSGFTRDLDLPPIVIIMMFQVIMLLLGFIIDEFIIVLMCAPIFTPVAVALGYDPIWFGVLMILNIVIAVQTPPYGFALFYLKGIAPKGVTMMDLYKSVTPFILVQLLVLIICMVFPDIVTWLPNKVMA
ncbi:MULTISPECIES: TRAP transporter large permease [Vibrio]|jgi:tripartite ATP-independent transporter DctM subunit|uniref:TRAP transporter large permease protein n=1 Tax=Vibrio diazotrophicus TaxID=685 RepID=A0A2J8G2Z9_VIBDI|nr:MULTISPECIES: TRAP transporter large permease subunit [Vibrio]MCF7361168.1 TRAP transporter large permease subunit [Vibrio sp. A1-b2]MCZ4370679.1 TRAP transporter large permease subunit [Vibrio diazotrophicus]PNH80355.1 C4-dicarboxylate ABC transporter permease [Vibrio diazotrophicus]PNH92029.1 C4-dicarboxylate ABC transporter permease [Vibrio diazotrophicus]PNH95794.1 C4-dicarboxylate ABC transporter permease [Vibrio diazotrophicus]